MKDLCNTPKVICLEGSDGSGKTTQAHLLNKCFTYNNLNSIYSREPGGSIAGEKIRKIILDTTFGKQEDICLYTFSRFVHIHETILPQLKRGSFVILDRYLPSTLIYQGRNSKSRIKKILRFHTQLNKNFFPDLTIILNITLEHSLKRIKQRKQKNFYDKKSTEFHNQIIELYTQVEKDYKGEVRYINANYEIDKIHFNIVKTINNFFSYNLKPLTENEIKFSLSEYIKN